MHENQATKQMSESKRNAELISNWYQSYYLWNSAVLANSVLNSNLATHSARVLNLPIIHINAVSNTASNRVAPTVVTRQVPIFKVPSLTRRFMAECLDALYIQCFKILIALFFINYTNLMYIRSIIFIC